MPDGFHPVQGLQNAMSTFRQKVQANTDWGKPDPEEATPVRGKWAAKRAAKNDRADEKPRKGPKRRAAQSPVTRHRLFPAFVALWFAALFGLGSLAISSAVLGKLVMAMGLPALVPAAAPPLGLTAHILVAFALTVVGGAFGLVLGLRMRPKTAAAPVGANPAPSPAPFAAEDERAGIQADVPKVRARDAHPDAPPRRPLVLTEAFADEAIAPAAPGGYRSEDLETVGAMEVAPETWIPVYTPGGANALEPLDLAALDSVELANDTPNDASDFLAPDFASLPASGQPISDAAPFAEPAPFAASAQGTAAQAAQAIDVLAEPAPEMPDVEVDAEAEAETEAEVVSAADMPRPVLLAATPQIPSGFTLPLPGDGALASGEAWSPVAGVPLASLGLVQLIERLALAIAARKAADNAGPPPAAQSAPPEFGRTESESPSAEGSKSIGLEDHGPACEAFVGTVPEGLAAASVDADLRSHVPASEPFAPFAKPAEPARTVVGEPVLSARDAILRRLDAVSVPVHIEPASDAGPGPFSRPQQAPAAAASATPPTAPLATVPASAAKAPFSGSMVNPEANPEANEALRSALATLQRMSARG